MSPIPELYTQLRRGLEEFQFEGEGDISAIMSIENNFYANSTMGERTIKGYASFFYLRKADFFFGPVVVQGLIPFRRELREETSKARLCNPSEAKR